MAAISHDIPCRQDATHNRAVLVGAMLCLSVGCATSPAPGVSTDAAAAPAAQGETDARRAKRAQRDTARAAALSQPENQRRLDRVRAYQIGALTEAVFWADGWNARDPVFGTLGVIALRVRSTAVPEAKYVLGVVSQWDVTLARDQTGSDLRIFLRGVAEDRQALLDATRARQTIDPMHTPVPLRFRVTQDAEGTHWKPAPNDFLLYSVTFVDGVLTHLEELPVHGAP